jgi:hypothetical protein
VAALRIDLGGAGPRQWLWLVVVLIALVVAGGDG